MPQFPDRIGGRLCLDYVNTVDPRRPGQQRDYLTDFESLIDWFAWLDVTLPRSPSWLRRTAARNPQEARASHRAALAVRESIFGVLESLRRGERVRAADLVALNRALGSSIGHRVLAPAERGGVREEWRPTDSLDQVVWPVAIDAWDLLTEPELALVRQCPLDAGGCGWYFLDTSRAGNRRWCDMRTCGNRAKVRAHYSRTTRA